VRTVPLSWLDTGQPEPVPRGHEVTSLRAKLVSGRDQIHRLRSELETLSRRVGAPVTGRPAWIFGALAAAPADHAWAVLVHDSSGVLRGSVVLLDVLQGESRTATLAGSSMGYRGAVVAEDELVAAALGHGLMDGLKHRGSDYQLELGPLDAADYHVKALVSAIPGAIVEPGPSVPVVRREGDGDVETYLTHNMLRTVRRSRNRLLRDQYALTVDFTRNPNDLIALLPELEICHRDRDYAHGLPSDLDDPLGRAAWETLLRGLSDEGSLELATLRIDGKFAAHALGIVDGTQYRVMEGRFVTEWSRFAPGRLLEAAVLQRVLDDPSFECLDWMTGVAPERLLATNGIDRVITVRLL
jgi:CelD/BcsL family acetyltransferase involved in cellulose biosynthesis